ncbi:hypothetical protein B6259_01160 [Ruminococcaceae bacterium CPB6]|nr:hypothetical protein B6259_01160 [Ruminococcaceae bacterium CPB6]
MAKAADRNQIWIVFYENKGSLKKPRIGVFLGCRRTRIERLQSESFGQTFSKVRGGWGSAPRSETRQRTQEGERKQSGGLFARGETLVGGFPNTAERYSFMPLVKFYNLQPEKAPIRGLFLAEFYRTSVDYLLGLTNRKAPYR